MSKKKIISLCLVICLLATAIGGTLAYFTDDEGATNAFTMGKVVIDLVEEQRNADGTGLEEFKDNNEPLMPMAKPQNGNKVNVGGHYLPGEESFVDKIVTVDNEGDQPAYVRVLVAFPEVMDDAFKAEDAMLQWIYDGEEAADTTGKWSRVDSGADVTIDGVVYNVYSLTYLDVLAAGETTKYPAMTGVYLNEKVEHIDNEDGTYNYYMLTTNGNYKSVTYDEGEGPKLYVIALGVQAAGFDNANDALEAGFGSIADNVDMWFEFMGEDMRADK